jgi:hypothetical protein
MIRYEYRTVEFHSILRHVLIEQGWNTHSVDDGVALMIRSVAARAMRNLTFSHGGHNPSYAVVVGDDSVARWKSNGSPLAPSIAAQLGREGKLSSAEFNATDRAYWRQQDYLRRAHVELAAPEPLVEG